MSTEYWPNPHEQFENESTHFLEQISDVLIFPPAVSNFIVLNYPIISVKEINQNLVSHYGANRPQRPKFPSSA